MKSTAKPLVAACALLMSSGLAAQTFKCKDDLGKITYSGKKCSDLGLKDAGEVKDKLNINPALPTTPQGTEGRPAARSAPPSAAPAVPAPETPAAAVEAPHPPPRSSPKNTPKGPATRCNDPPSSEAPPD